jgi:hypothetical protein
MYTYHLWKAKSEGINTAVAGGKSIFINQFTPDAEGLEDALREFHSNLKEWRDFAEERHNMQATIDPTELHLSWLESRIVSASFVVIPPQDPEYFPSGQKEAVAPYTMHFYVVKQKLIMR